MNGTLLLKKIVTLKVSCNKAGNSLLCDTVIIERNVFQYDHKSGEYNNSGL